LTLWIRKSLVELSLLYSRHVRVYPRLFTKSATNSVVGTGLGLYISKNIIEAHGGRMWAENNAEARGATFSFSLPLD
jgi:two-component system, OmpR family, sensor histidine kinase VicK